MPTALNHRSRLQNDPLRNFKFQVQMTNPEFPSSYSLSMGFTSVEGLNMSTEMIPYREGGWNTNPHKMAGMTDFSPVTFSSGVFAHRPQLWNMARQMFSVQWGGGSLGLNDDYRFDVTIRVFDHPVTKGEGALVQTDVKYPMVAFKLYNAWVANIAYGGLNAMENSILIHQMTIHHEGLATWFNTERSDDHEKF